MKRFAIIVLLTWCIALCAAEVIPPAPANHFNDYAGIVSPPAVTRLNQRLQAFERQTGNQVVVAVFPTMQSDSSIEDYTVRVAEAWKVGQKGRDNGAVLFVFVKDRTMYLQVGYGLEGALPDATAKQIIENELKPRFRQGNFDAGFEAGVNAIIAATKGEYKGTGKTVAETRAHGKGAPVPFILFIVIGIFVLMMAMRGNRRRGWVITHHGYGSSHWGGSSWGAGGGGFGSGGGGTFSGGGGSFGGGGAGGRW